LESQIRWHGSVRGQAFEEENAKLKRLLAEQMLDTAALRELLSKKW
jgi:putative transposase